MRRFEGLERNNRRFYEIEISDKTVVTTSGLRDGSRKPATKREVWANPRDAFEQAERFIAKKLKMGFKEVEAAKLPAPKPAREPGKVDARACEKAIIEDRDEPGPWLVYADALHAAGDPRGELIVVQELRAREPKNRKALIAEDEIFDAHYSRFVGESVAEHIDGKYLTVTWRNGFFHEASLKDSTREMYSTPTAEETLEALFESPSARLLDGLTIDSGRMMDSEREGIYTFGGLARWLSDAPNRPPLRSLALLRSYRGVLDPIDADRLLAAFPTLRALTLEGTLQKLGAARFQLEAFSLTGPSPVLSTLTAKPWPKLRRLSLGCAGLDAADLGDVLAGHAFPHLEHLALRKTSGSDEVAEALAKSPLMLRLKSLDLSRGNLTRRGATALGSVKRTQKLDLVDVTRNRLDDLAKRAIRNVAHDVIGIAQKG